MADEPHDDAPDAAAPAGEERPRGRADTVSAEVVGKDYVLHDEATGRVHFLNQTAALVWDLCDGTRTGDEIAAEVARLYDREAAAVRDDVRRALDEFRAGGLFAPADAS